MAKRGLRWYKAHEMHPTLFPAANGVVAEVGIGDYGDGDDGVGPLGEFMVEWHRFENHTPDCPKLGMLSDSWAILGKCPELVALFAGFHGKDPTPEEFTLALVKIGIPEWPEAIKRRANRAEQAAAKCKSCGR